MPEAVATRYARALVDIVFSPNAGIDPRQVAGHLRAFQGTMKESPELRGVMATPAVSLASKRAVVDRLAAAMALPPLVVNFLKVLVNHRRMAMLDEVTLAFERLMNDRLGVLQVNVTSAVELQPGQVEAIEGAMGRATGKQISLHQSVDRELIGGLVARIGSTVFDGSVRGKLDAIARRMGSAQG